MKKREPGKTKMKYNHLNGGVPTIDAVKKHFMFPEKVDDIWYSYGVTLKLKGYAPIKYVTL